MTDERSTFEVTRARLEDIVAQVRRKDVSLEQSLDLLEEAVRLVNQCNDLIDQTSFQASAASVGAEPRPDAIADGADGDAVGGGAAPAAPDAHTPGDEGEDAALDVVGSVETYGLVDADGGEVAVIESVEISAMDDVTPDADGIEDDERS
jgi:exodeoxyribonuclease VII small subunit